MLSTAYHQLYSQKLLMATKFGEFKVNERSGCSHGDGLFAFWGTEGETVSLFLPLFSYDATFKYVVNSEYIEANRHFHKNTKLVIMGLMLTLCSHKLFAPYEVSKRVIKCQLVKRVTFKVADFTGLFNFEWHIKNELAILAFLYCGVYETLILTRGHNILQG